MKYRLALFLMLWAPQLQAQAEEPANPCNNLPQKAGFLDHTHNWLSQSVCWPSRWVDDFFADPSTAIDDEPGTLLRVITAQRWQDNDETGSDFKVRAKVELPHAERKYSLLFRNDDDVDEELSNDVSTRPEEVGEEQGGFRSALRWMIGRTSNSDLDLDAGIRSDIKLFARARYRLRYLLPGGKTWFRFTQKGFWEDPDGFGTSSLFEFDRPITEQSTLRLSTEAELTEENNELKRDWEFTQSASFFVRLGERSGINFTAGLSGHTDPVAVIDTYRTSVRFRRNIWRSWLYYEIEPFAFWPREDNYHGVTGIVFRIETQFGLLDHD